MSKHQAYFFNSEYLLPLNEEQFSEKLSSGTPFTAFVRILIESAYEDKDGAETGLCIAPYFLSDSVELFEEREIVPAFTYPVQIELLTQQEYNSRLRKVVCAFCPGCKNYGALNDDDRSLNGHFVEISLDSVCFLRRVGRERECFAASLLDMMTVCGNSQRIKDSQMLVDFAQNWLGVKYDLAITDTESGRILLTYKPNVFYDAITSLLASCLKYCGFEYRIETTGIHTLTEARILKEIGLKRFPQLCKKFGLGFMKLEYNALNAEEVKSALSDFDSTPVMFRLVDDWFLVTDVPAVLSDLRYCAPALEACGAYALMYDETGAKRYKISFAMNSEEL